MKRPGDARPAGRGEPRRPAYHHGDLRAALLRAAEEELAEKGVEAFSLRGCAKRADVSHAAPAHHFGDADGLLTALAAEGFSRFSAAMRARQADGRSLLVAAGLGYVDFALAHPALFRLMFSSARPHKGDAALRAAGEAAFAILVESVAQARGGSPWGGAGGAADVAATWATAHGLADLLLAGRLPFLRGGAGEKPDDATLAAVFERLRLGR